MKASCGGLLGAVLALILLVLPALDLAGGELGASGAAGSYCQLHANPAIGAPAPAPAPPVTWHPLVAGAAPTFESPAGLPIFVPPRPVLAF